MNATFQNNRQSFLLKACIFATGLSGIVAEFTLSTLASYLLGNTTLQWALVMSMMLFAMGVGSRLSRYVEDRLLDRFIAVEFVLSLLCATSAVAAYFGSLVAGGAGTFIYLYALAIGGLIGMEIPLVARMNEAYEGLRTNISGVMEKDYYGALAGGLVFAFFALPYLGLTYTPIALGAVNFAVASLLFWRYRTWVGRPIRMQVGFWAVGATLVALAALIRPIVTFGEQSQYRDRVVYSEQTRFQKIVMTRWKDDYWLYLNRNVQFSTYDEERYHEPLVHPAMVLSGRRENVLIFGGGDGLALREVLKYGEVKQITLVDLDPAMTRLGATHPALVKANGGAFADPRVRVVNEDAALFLEETGKLFDVMIIDLPDPQGPNLARLYTREFYATCARQLAEEGTLVTQSSSPLHARKAFLCVMKTVEAAGFSALPYQVAIPTMGTWGWVVARKASSLSPSELRRLAEAEVYDAVETAFLDAESGAGMLRFWRGMFEGQEALAINTLFDPVVDAYYREAEWGF